MTEEEANILLRRAKKYGVVVLVARDATYLLRQERGIAHIAQVAPDYFRLPSDAATEPKAPALIRDRHDLMRHFPRHTLLGRLDAVGVVFEIAPHATPCPTCGRESDR